MVDPLIQVRDALTTTTNTTGVDNRGLGSAELQKVIDRMTIDNVNRGLDIRPLIVRKPVTDGKAHIWNIKTDLGTTSKAAVYSEGGSGTPYPSTTKQMSQVVISWRSDYEVTGLMQVTSSVPGNILLDEAKDALDDMKIMEEKMIICGDVTSAYGVSNSFNGLQKIMRWNGSNGGDTEPTAANDMGDTTTIFGATRADNAGSRYLDCSYVLAGTVGTSTGTLELKHLDEAIRRSNKKGAKSSRRIFFCSEDRHDYISRLLQPQQRFIAGAGQLELEGGFRVLTYRSIPIIGSQYMDKNGNTNTGSWDKNTDADNNMYLLDMDHIEMRIAGGVDYVHTSIAGQGDSTNYEARADAIGGWFKTYGTLIVSKFNSQVNICNLTPP